MTQPRSTTLAPALRRSGPAEARTPRLVPWLLGCFLLTACATGPDATQSRPAAAASFHAERSFAGPPADWPAPAWWTDFRDPQLERLMEEAFAQSPSIAQAQARLQVAEARAGGVRSALRPSLSAQGAVTDQKFTYN